ncbi:UNVERIFIED_CONTAM: hypothetical protein FKN15_076276 [Acipenser sinensis]
MHFVYSQAIQAQPQGSCQSVLGLEQKKLLESGGAGANSNRQHLERQTRETQRLQEEVEQATKLTMERMGRSLAGTTHEQPVSLNCSVDNSLNAQDLLTSHHISVSNHERPYSIKSMAYRPEPAATVRSISFPGREHLERALEEYSLQVKELQRRLSEPKTTALQEDPAHDIKKLLKELRSMIQEDRNASAPARNSTDVETPASPWGNKDVIDPLTLHTVDLEDELSINTLGPEGYEPSFISVAPRFTSSPRKHFPEPRSPVHSLLTAPLSSRPQQPGRSGGAPMEEVSKMCSMIQNQEKRIKKVKDREKLSTN